MAGIPTAFHTPATPLDAFIWVMIGAGLFFSLTRVGGRPLGAMVAGGGLLGLSLDARLYIPVTLIFVGMLAFATGRTPQPPLSARRVFRELALLVTGFLAYEQGRSITQGNLDEARRNAGRIISMERHLGLLVEQRMQQVVLQSDTAVAIFNRIYSFLYLPFVLAVLLWLLISDDASYRLLRTTLGLSAAIAVLILWLFPVAPPRLMPDLAIIDTHQLVGLKHTFVNEYAAIPSFHVGWTALASYTLARSLVGRFWRALAWLPVLIMAVTVIVTGNHLWLDGVVGSVVTLVPAVLLAHLYYRASPTRKIGRQHVRRVTAATFRTLAGSKGTSFAAGSLGALLGWLVVGQIVSPGFTHYWGYMVAQIAVTIVLVLYLTHTFRDHGGFSWLTIIVVVGATYLDTLGTAGHMYDRLASYDKIAHFAGTAALAATGSDILRLLTQRGTVKWTAVNRMFVAIGVAILLGASWELYEFAADIIFATYRHAGALDTIYDLISDITGALVTGIALWRLDSVAATEMALETTADPPPPAASMVQ